MVGMADHPVRLKLLDGTVLTDMDAPETDGFIVETRPPTEPDRMYERTAEIEDGRVVFQQLHPVLAAWTVRPNSRRVLPC